eukprot:CAMPEP_0171187314 /NCGR_PEP_ID=MMETSP0790-20130122/17258_1 /TAXON_ID=2925 /ORGANISM="Alexandrium catenella, Strain OF101" /LENGTH=123 /DNA_ID=CAMNT_0011652373 /DNA_START=326 /DNA_END=697 /DNA_ORIENTATION=+
MHNLPGVTRLRGRYRITVPADAHRVGDALRSLGDAGVKGASVEQYHVAGLCGEVEVERRPKRIRRVALQCVEAASVELVLVARALLLRAVAAPLYLRPVPVAPVVEAHGHRRVRNGQPHRDHV